MVTRNFGFDRGGILFKCFSLGIIFIRRAGTIPSLTCSRLRSAPNSVVVNLRTSSRIMPKKGKVTGGAQQSSDPLKLEGEEGILSAISLTKGSQICLKILAKPGAKQSNVTGEERRRWETCKISIRVGLVDRSPGIDIFPDILYPSPSPPLSYLLSDFCKFKQV